MICNAEIIKCRFDGHSPKCPTVSLRLLAPIIGKLCGFSRGQFRSCPHALSTWSPHRKCRKCKCESRYFPMRIRNGPLCARGRHHKGICNAFVHAPRARIARGTTRLVPLESFAKRATDPRHACSLFVCRPSPSIYARGQQPRFLTRTFAFPNRAIRPGPLVALLLKNVIMKFALTSM